MSGRRRDERRRAAGCRPPGEIRVLLVDDDALVRAGLSMMLNGSDGLVIVGEAEDGDQVPARGGEAPARRGADGPADAPGGRDRRHQAAARRATAARGHRADHLRRGRERARRAARRRQRLPAQGLAARRDRERDQARRRGRPHPVPRGDPAADAARRGAGERQGAGACGSSPALSPRELEVVRAIADGQTQRGDRRLAADERAHRQGARDAHPRPRPGLANRTQIALLAHDAELA